MKKYLTVVLAAIFLVGCSNEIVDKNPPSQGDEVIGTNDTGDDGSYENGDENGIEDEYSYIGDESGDELTSGDWIYPDYDEFDEVLCENDYYMICKDTHSDISSQTDFIGVWDKFEGAWSIPIQEFHQVSDNYGYANDCGEGMFVYWTNADTNSVEAKEVCYINANTGNVFYIVHRTGSAAMTEFINGAAIVGEIKGEDRKANEVTLLHSDGSFEYLQTPWKFNYEDYYAYGDAMLNTISDGTTQSKGVLIPETWDMFPFPTEYEENLVTDYTWFEYDEADNQVRVEYLVGDNDNAFQITLDMDGNVIDGPTLYD